ncbi:MAG: FtsX-like permease family protein, partial [Planctomycetaceae bacterium]|nr:FtsX-like permease family protein [Planctomycetaceae bacterium]
MTRSSLMFRSITYHWRNSLAVIAGVIAGTAVIGGALIVGDSVRGSLQQMTLDRLGDIDHALTSQRLLTENLAERLAEQPEFQQQFSAVAPLLLLQATLEVETAATGGTAATGSGSGSHAGGIRRVNQVRLYGVDERFWKLAATGGQAEPEAGQIILNQRVAEQLGAEAGSTISVRLETPSAIPRDTLLGKTQEASIELNPTVQVVLPEASGLGRLELNPNQQLPLVAFMPLDELQQALDISEIRRTRRNPEGREAQVNALFVSAREPGDSRGASAPAAAETLNGLLQKSLSLKDAGLRVVVNEDYRYLSLESEQQILGDVYAAAGREAARQQGLETSPVLVYLANELRNASLDSTEGEEAPVSKYSVVAGVDLSATPPFGPLPFAGEPPALPLKPASLAKLPADNRQSADEESTLQEEHPLEEKLTPEGGPVVINDWLARDLQLKVGDWLLVKYFPVGSNGYGEELERLFHVRGIVEMEDEDREPTRAADRGLTPEVPGITDAENFDDWEQPFPMKLPVPARDDEYWGEYRATPKVFVPLATAQELWSSRYGSLTSLRVAVPEEDNLPQLRELFTETVLQQLDLAEAGLTFEAVKFRGLQAASGTTDFAGLFIGFSFFLILSAMILIGLLFRLGIERRGRNIGLLSAVGFSPKQVRWLFLQEGLVLVLVGALIGTAAAAGYARIMVYGLKTWWIGAIGTRFLDVYLMPASLAMGFGISVVVAGGAVLWALRGLRQLSPRSL